MHSYGTRTALFNHNPMIYYRTYLLLRYRKVRHRDAPVLLPGQYIFIAVSNFSV